MSSDLLRRPCGLHLHHLSTPVFRPATVRVSTPGLTPNWAGGPPAALSSGLQAVAHETPGFRSVFRRPNSISGSLRGYKRKEI
ncbi:hypothetical protein NDU88_003681 [Pleurodeles waltl]|uniref:Uncharacterized protein n=1 Tax=Pleurodeles waltl TaxID=8319 RepID=A0AAV7M5T1_PLEWA|nr:hypothetical protein NDU88_003681 [Pleurodeles waltl]